MELCFLILASSLALWFPEPISLTMLSYIERYLLDAAKSVLQSILILSLDI